MIVEVSTRPNRLLKSPNPKAYNRNNNLKVQVPNNNFLNIKMNNPYIINHNINNRVDLSSGSPRLVGDSSATEMDAHDDQMATVISDESPRLHPNS